MARIIDRLMVAGEPAIVSFNGGTKDNAINRECKAVLVYATTLPPRRIIAVENDRLVRVDGS